MASQPVWRRRRISGPIAWAGLCVSVGILVVLITRGGFDVLALLVAAFLLLVVERTVGDWLAETIGPAPAALLFVIVAVLGVFYVTTDQGQARVDSLFDAAAARGYKTTYFRIDRKGRAADSVSAPAGGGGGPISPPSLPKAPPPAAAPVLAPDRGGEPATGVRIGRLRVMPEVSTPRKAVVFRADLSAERAGTFPAVVFSVNGRVVATATPDAAGVAQTEWRTAVPGQYVVRARVPGRLFDLAAASARLTVLPGTR